MTEPSINFGPSPRFLDKEKIKKLIKNNKSPEDEQLKAQLKMQTEIELKSAEMLKSINQDSFTSSQEVKTKDKEKNSVFGKDFEQKIYNEQIEEIDRAMAEIDMREEVSSEELPSQKDIHKEWQKAILPTNPVEDYFIKEAERMKEFSRIMDSVVRLSRP